MSFDFAIIGAGMAGASIAAELAPHGRTILLEAEEVPGYHATGRSAAFWSETYGGPGVQRLTSASFGFLEAPPADFADRGFLGPRGALYIAEREGEAALAELAASFAGSGVELREELGPQLARRVPELRPEWRHGLWEASCRDIDVAALHQAFLAAARREGALLRCGAPVRGVVAAGGMWRITAAGEPIEARVVVNAAGAWADRIAVMAGVRRLGIVPHRRTMLQLRVEPPAPDDLPLVIDALGRFYFKGEAGGRLWLSPHDESPAVPGDAAPEEIDVARAVDRLERVTRWQVAAVERKWAGLRSFAPDRLPVYGFHPGADGFFWCAGQGGFGIQTAPAAARLCRSLVLGRPLDEDLRDIDPDAYAPGRLLDD